MELRGYQGDMLNAARRSIAAGNRRIIITLPCGGGKTIIAAAIVSGALDKGNNALFLVHRRELAYQAIERFSDFGIGDKVGIIMAGEDSNLGRPVQVASIQTYIRRLMLNDLEWNNWYHKANVVIFDEAHCSLAPSYKKVIDLYAKNSVVIGLTATPCRGDGRGLGVIYKDIITRAGIGELTDLGYLVPMIYYAPHTPDLKKIKIIAGDYCNKELGDEMDKPKLVGDIYDNWARIAPDRQTIIFATNVKHSLNIKAQFENRDVKVEHLDAHTPKDLRAETLARLKSGETQVVTNCQILTEGFDYPGASCIVLARPTKSYGLYIQMAGRGLRPYAGKENCILIDHSGCVSEHGFVDEDVFWSLDDKEKAWSKKADKKRERKPVTCEMCMFVFNGPKCPQCGTVVQNYGKKVCTTDDCLVEVGRNKRPKATMEEKRRFFAMLEYRRRERGYSPGWSSHKYREKFGCWPKSLGYVKPLEPDAGFRNWMTHLAIKWAKGKGREDAARCQA